MEVIIITCKTCGAWWNMDYDPPECDDPNHEQDLKVYDDGN